MPAIANRQSQISNPQDWIPLEEAVPLLGFTDRHIRRLAAGKWMADGKAMLRAPRSEPGAQATGRSTWWLHRSLDPRLSRAPDQTTRADRAKESLLSRYPFHYVERAYTRARWVAEWRKRLAGPRVAGQTDRDIAAQVVSDAAAGGFQFAVRTLQAWHSAMHEIGGDGQVRGVEALIDRYGPSLGDGDGNGSPTRSPAACAYFFDLYRTELKLSVKQCHLATVREARRESWVWPADYSSTVRWLKGQDDIPLSFLCREGKKAWTKKFMPYNEQDWRAVEPGQFYVADHHQVDFWVRYKDSQIRPWLTAIQDCRTRRIVGWTLGPAPHQEAILCALRMAFRAAVPDVLRIDNGKDFTAKAITGLTKKEVRRLRSEYGRHWKDVIRKSRELVGLSDPRWHGIVEELKIELIYAIPYSAWSKGTLERFFRTFEEQCGKTFATYTGNNTLTRPESVGEIRDGYTGRGAEGLILRDGAAIPTLDEANAVVGDWMVCYESTPHSGRGVDGATPLAVWQSAQHLRKAVDAELDFLMSVRGAYRVGPNGVSLKVGASQMVYGKRCTALMRDWVGRDVLVAVDPQFPARCVAFDPATRRMIAPLEPNDRLNPLATTDDLREAQAEIMRGRKVAQSYERTSARRTLTATQRTNRSIREQAAEYKATGTDGAPQPDIRAVRTRFEAVSVPVQTTFEVSVPDPSELMEFSSGEVFDDGAYHEEAPVLALGDLLSDSGLQGAGEGEADPLSQLL